MTSGGFSVFSMQQVGYDGLYEPTVKLLPDFNAAADVEVLYKAMKGFGTDEKSLIRVLGQRVSLQREEIVDKYLREKKKPLLDEIKSETSGDFRETLVKLVRDVCYTEAEGLYKAMKGLGTNERRLNQILMGKSNEELHRISEAYQLVLGDNKKDANRILLGDIRSETSGPYRDALTYMLEYKRDECTGDSMRVAIEQGAKNVLDMRMVQQDAQVIYESLTSSQKDLGSVCQILFTRSYVHIEAICKEFVRMYSFTLYDFLADNLGGDFRELVLDLVEYCEERADYFARLIRSTMAGLGTKDEELMRLIITRSELDLGSIMYSYEALYGRQMIEDIKGDTSGDYRLLLLTLCGYPA